MPPTDLSITFHDLADMPLFRHVASESVDGLLQRCRQIELRSDEVLLRQGDANQNLYIVLSGELAIRLSSPDNDPVALLGRGETIGEMSLIDQKGASAYVIATRESRLLVFDEQSLWSLVRFSHPAACNLLSILTARLRNTNIALSERMQLDHDFHQYGSVDALTGLHNRYWLDNTLPRLVRRHERSGEPLSLIMTDIDLFKSFNTRYGHLCGDHVIHAVARVLIENLRPSEMAARYGGDEFVIILPGVSLEHARLAAERLRKIVDETSVRIPGGGSVATPTISIGIAQYRPGESSEAFIEAADSAMYRAKDQGRDTVSE